MYTCYKFVGLYENKFILNCVIILFIIVQFNRMDSGSNIRGRDSAWKYCTHMEGNRNGTVFHYYGLVIKGGGITHFKFHLSHLDPHSNTKKSVQMCLRK